MDKNNVAVGVYTKKELTRNANYPTVCVVFPLRVNKLKRLDETFTQNFY